MACKYVPEDILLKILENLPTISLLRFKCASKHWNRLISDPSFTKPRSRSMILLPGKLFQTINNTTPGDSKAYLVQNLIRFPSGLVPEGKQLKVAGTINGIVLLVVDFHSDMILYNPLTKEFNKVPNPPSHHHCSNYHYMFGFGYGTAPDDLKIIKIGRGASDAHGSRPFDMFSFRTWSWNTDTLRINYYSDNQFNGIFVNGCLYWMVYGPTRMILVLDLVNVVFSRIELPPAELGVFPLGTLKGNLCAICYSRTNDTENELWVMKEHGVCKTWSKVSTLTSLTRDNCLWTSITKCMSILDEGKLVMLKGECEVIIYDMLEDSYKKVKSLTCLGTQAIEYMESCVSSSIWQRRTRGRGTDKKQTYVKKQKIVR